MKWLDKISFTILIIISLTLGLAPFTPEPHVWEKLKLLANGDLSRPIDIFDLLLHGSAPTLLALKALFLLKRST